VFGAISLSSLPASAGVPADFSYGLGCMETFTDPDLNTLTNACDNTSAFSSQVSSIGTELFRYSLEGSIGPAFLEEAYDGPTKAESVDLIMIATHTGSQGTDDHGNPTVQIAGKDWPSRGANNKMGVAWSSKMNLGNEGKGLSILAIVGCGATAWYPHPAGNGYEYAVFGSFRQRWTSAFSGGLRIVLGNWDQGYDTKTKGDKFGKYVKAGLTLKDAWRRSDWESDQRIDTSIVSMALNQDECFDRLNNMTIANYPSYPRRRGADAAGYACFEWWTNDSIGERPQP